MRLRLGVLVVLLALAGAACQQNGNDDDVLGETDSASEEFAITGTVVDAKAGVEPEGGFPGEEEEDADATDEPLETDEAEDTERGGIAIRPDNEDAATNLDDCEMEQGTFITYYVEDTDFEPASLEDDENFPENVQGQRVSVQGTVEQSEETGTDVDADADAQAEDGDVDADAEVTTTDEAEEPGCILVLDEVEIAEEIETSPGTGDDDADGTTGGTATEDPDATGSPGVTSSPGAMPGLPEGVEDTDPIFEGTPSPDPCEGRKACAEED